MTNLALLEVSSLDKQYSVRLPGRWSKHSFNAISDINFVVQKGDTICIVGESGCGKSTLARVLSNIVKPSAGRIVFEGRDVGDLSGRASRLHRKNVQLIFQDPYASLNPRMSIGKIVSEPLENFSTLDAAARRKKVENALVRVGLAEKDYDRLPVQLSGGQRQRVGIARAIVSGPQIIIADEAVSALDVSVKSQILNLLQELQDQLGLTYLFVTHDIGVVHNIADKLIVMYLGRVVEQGDGERILGAPRHPYTRMLLSSVPLADPEHKMSIAVQHGEMPSALFPPSGCVFRTRCQHATELCKQPPPVVVNDKGDACACHYADEI
jgi:peptide/nickel transport system ATP-binding protein/oligopeptide transport system ATP-binding protein